ncbi:MAG TPA: ATP-grasp domain-containing protein [Methanocorpusculum sp.]|nr:ATP-grasp domain-containing protein [Methanocorpusculum sp.]
MSKSVLVVGYTTRHVAASAAAAGYTVYAADHFCDQDLLPCTADHMAFDELEELPFAADELIQKYHPDYVVTTSGAELLEFKNRLGTSPDAAQKFMNKAATQEFFESLGIPVPKKLEKGVYPAMAKTTGGAGGWRNAVVHSDEELALWQEFVEGDPCILQEFIEGMPASVCCLVTPSGEACVLTTNQQILRGGDFCPYAFSGSVTPCPHPMAERMKELGKKIAEVSGCVGCIGIDFVLTDTEAYAIEVNPRFQGTLETVETALGENLFTLHKNACKGVLPKELKTPKQYAVRKILTAPEALTLKADLLPLSDFLTDIPFPGTFFEKGEVLCSVIGYGRTVEEASAVLDKNISIAVQYINQ